MIKRQWIAQPVTRGGTHDLRLKQRVVDDIVVRQCRPFRRAGRARGKLDIRRIVRLHQRRQLCEARMLLRAAHARNTIETIKPGLVDGLHMDDGRQMRHTFGTQ
jgi:hypothetical protein